MSEAHELKPCPFCGGEAGATKDGDYHVVMCSNCMASLADRTRWTAVHMWNTRTDAFTPQMAAKVLLGCGWEFHAPHPAFEAAAASCPSGPPANALSAVEAWLTVISEGSK